jgi:hypothetical protein
MKVYRSSVGFLKHTPRPLRVYSTRTKKSAPKIHHSNRFVTPALAPSFVTAGNNLA